MCWEEKRLEDANLVSVKIEFITICILKIDITF